MAVEISLKKGTANPTSGLTLAEPLFNSTNNTLWMGKGSANTPIWIGAGICGASGGIAAGLTYQIPTLGAVKDYFSAVSSNFLGTTASYVSSFNGLTGAVGGVCAAQANTFTALQTFTTGISASGGMTLDGGKVWHSLNDGPTSGLDAGQLYGVTASLYASSLSTGLLYGGLVTINAGNSAAFDVSAGAGYIVTTGATFTAEPTPVITRVAWTAKTGVTLSGLTAQDTTWIYFDSSGNLNQQSAFFTDDQVQSTIAVGALVHPSRAYINLAKTIPNLSYATDKQYEQFIRAFGPLKVSGHTIQANGANLKLNRTSGTAFILGRNYPNDPNNPSVVSDNAQTDCTFWRYYRGATAGSFVTVLNQTAIDPENYDDGTGTLNSVPSNKPFTIQRLFFFPGTPSVLGVYYGHASYASISEAANNVAFEDFTEITNTATNAVFVGYVLVKKGTTNLTTAIAADDARIIQSGQFRSTTSGGGTIATNLDSLNDVTITSVQDDDLLIYDTATSQWLNTPLLHIGVTRVNGLTGAVQAVSSFNGRTGAVQGVSAAVAGTGISVSGATGAVTITNIGVQSFNGLTGAVTGVTVGGANTFTALNSFNAGISAAGGTLSSNTTIPSGSTLTVNGNFVANGNVNLGDAVTDAITVTGVLAANGGLSAAGGTFSSLTRFTAGISSAGGTFSSLTRFTAGITASTLYVSGGATFGNLTAPDIYSTTLRAVTQYTDGLAPYTGTVVGINGEGNLTTIGDYGFEGDSDFFNNGTYISVNDTTQTVRLRAPNGINTIGSFLNTVSAPSFTDTYSFVQTYRTTTTATTANQTIATIDSVYDNTQIPPVMGYPAFEVTISARDTVLNKTEMLKMLVVQDGTNTVNTQYGLIRTGATGPVSSYSTTLSGFPKNLLIRATPLSTNNTVFTTTVRAQSNG